MRKLPELNTNKRSVYLLRLILNGTAQAGVVIAMALLLREAFDALITSDATTDFQSLLPFLAGFSLIVIINASLRGLERVDAEKLGQDYIFEVRQQLFAHMSGLSPRALQKRSSGGTMLRFVGDLSALRQWISLGIARLAVASISTLGALFILFYINVMLAALVTGLLLMASIAILILGLKLENSSRNTRKHRSRLAANISEKISTMAVVQVFGQRKREQNLIKKQSNALRDSMVQRSRHIGQLRAVIEALIGFANAGVIILGAWEISQGHITPGTVVAAVMIVNMLASPLRDLGRAHEYWRGAKISREKIINFLNAHEPIKQQQSPHHLEVSRGEIEFRNVCAANIINNFSNHAKAGQRIALVGPNGAGKSTLLSLVTRLLDPQSGQIFIDGQDIATCSLRSLQASIGVVGPDLPLLRGSIERNLKYRLPNASKEQIKEVETFCGIEKLTHILPKGIRSRITEGGLNLSVGQRARVTLARALLGTPPILLLDEAEANLDSDAAKLIKQVLQTYHGTIIMVTHRQEYLKYMDQIWQLGQATNEYINVAADPTRVKAS